MGLSTKNRTKGCETARLNKIGKSNHLVDLDIFNNRPTIRGFVAYCRHFLSHNSEIVTDIDPVTAALEEINYSETDLISKILFINQFDTYESNDPCEVLKNVYYSIAIPQKDSITILHNRWYTLNKNLDECDKISIFYNKINSITLDDKLIHIELVGGSEKTITLPYEKRHSLFEYQGDDPTDKLTYSITHTCNPQEFVAAVENLLTAQK